MREKAGKIEGDSNKKGKQGGVCKKFWECGGCEYKQDSYKRQLKEKQKRLEELIGGFCEVHPIVGMENPFHYRNKVHAVVDRDKKGNVITGVYKAGTHMVVPVDSCMIEDEKADEIIVTIRGMLKSFKIKTYDEDTEYGLLRHILIRKGFATGEIMVVLVTASPVFPSKNNFVKALLKVHPEITTIVQNINGRGTSMVLGEKEHILYGKGYIEDRLCGCIFRISSKSFYQVNPVQTEKLYSLVLDYAGLNGNEIVWDLYCGIGTISLFLAQRAKYVYGVEVVANAVDDAKTNARINGIENVEFFVGKVEEVVPSFSENDRMRPDVIVVDPPRKGCDQKCLETIVAMLPERVVYVSCDSATLARDLKYLCERGYEVREVQPVDMFPQTTHVESVCLLHRKDS